MKRRKIVSIFAALALAVGSSALLTGCAGKSYWYKAVEQPDGTVSYELVGEIVSAVEGTASTTTESTASTAETPSETTSEAPSETPEETPSETPEETPSETPEETPSETPEEPSEAETPAESADQTDGDTLAVIKFEKPEDWDGSALYLRVYDDNSNNNGDKGQLMTADSDGLYSAVVSKNAQNGVAFENPRFIFLGTTDAGKMVQSEEGTLNGDKTYGVEKDGRNYVLVEK